MARPRQIARSSAASAAPGSRPTTPAAGASAAAARQPAGSDECSVHIAAADMVAAARAAAGREGEGGARGRAGGAAGRGGDLPQGRARVAGVEGRGEGRRAVDAARQRGAAARAGDAVQARRRRLRGPDHEALRRPADRDGHDARGLRLPPPARQIRHAAAQRQQAPRPAARGLRLRHARGHPRPGREPRQRHRHPLQPPAPPLDHSRG